MVVPNNERGIVLSYQTEVSGTQIQLLYMMFCTTVILTHFVFKMKICIHRHTSRSACICTEPVEPFAERAFVVVFRGIPAMSAPSNEHPRRIGSARLSTESLARRNEASQIFSQRWNHNLVGFPLLISQHERCDTHDCSSEHYFLVNFPSML